MKPSLHNGEKTIQSAQGSLQFHSSWQMGHLLLSSRQLLFTYGAKKIFEISLERIREICIMKRTWFLGVGVKQLCIDFNSGRGLEQVYIALAKPEKWADAIKESMTLRLAERWGYDEAGSEPPSNPE